MKGSRVLAIFAVPGTVLWGSCRYSGQGTHEPGNRIFLEALYDTSLIWMNYLPQMPPRKNGPHA